MRGLRLLEERIGASRAVRTDCDGAPASGGVDIAWASTQGGLFLPSDGNWDCGRGMAEDGSALGENAPGVPNGDLGLREVGGEVTKPVLVVMGGLESNGIGFFSSATALVAGLMIDDSEGVDL